MIRKHARRRTATLDRARTEAGSRLRRVLVATDFSAGADRALGRAARLPLAERATVTLLHVLPPGAAARSRLISGARRALAEAAAELREVSRGQGGARWSIRPHLAHGKPSDEIPRQARSSRAELVVIGRRGSGGIRGLLIGSTAERAARACESPVLVIARTPASPYVRPLVAMDLEGTSRRALELVLRLTSDRPATLRVIHAVEPIYDFPLRALRVPAEEIRSYRAEAARDARNIVTRQLASLGREGRRWMLAVRQGDPRVRILAAVDRERPDLVALGTHRRSRFARLALGSVAEAVLRLAPCDVLVAKPPADTRPR